MNSQQIFLPPQWAFSGRIGKNPLMQLSRPAIEVDSTVTDVKNGHLCMWIDNDNQEHTTLILSKIPSQVTPDVDEVLITPSGMLLESPADWELNRSKIKWVSPAPTVVKPSDVTSISAAANAALESWKGQFSFHMERVSQDGSIAVAGLRPPQIGALHAVLSHWTVELSPATIVMPTGTGKTETMLSLLTSQCLQRVLVIVPSVALREQIFNKFASLGVLKGRNGWGGILSKKAHFPVVGRMDHGFKKLEEASSFFESVNVVVANVDTLTACSQDVKNQLSKWCSHLFVDEAHHSAAATWLAVRLGFKIKEKPILGFTATPYRNDEKLVEGKVIYSYPLIKAQKEGYFTPITFKSVRAFSQKKADYAIARTAIQQLDEDIKSGYSHLVMARAADINRAGEVYAYYQKLAPSHNPELIHSDLAKEEQRAIIRRLRNGESRIVVCVAMFGEGFDLPELKIAAMHDIHKTLAITLQFTGRFTRGRKDLGSATLIANIANPEVQDSMRSLYNEDPNWNKILHELSSEATGRQIARTEFLRGFSEVPDDLAIQNLRPKLSTETYRTNCRDWNPEAINSLLPKKQLLVPPIINYEAKVILFVTRQEIDVPWANVRNLSDVSHNLHLIHFDSKRNLLFINSSDTKQIHKGWAEAICSASAQLIEGEEVFRALDGLNRMLLLNAGLKDTLSHAVRFMMLMGPDVRDAIKSGQMENRIKANLFTRGFREGLRTSVGCSAKGRVWTQAVAEDVTGWVKWCGDVGDRLLDSSVNLEQLLQNALIPEIITERPNAVPIAFEWNEETINRGEDCIFLEFKGEHIPFFDAELQVVNLSSEGSLAFRVRMELVTLEENEGVETEVLDSVYEIRFEGTKFSYHPLGSEIFLSTGRRRTSVALSDWLNSEPLTIRFHDGSWLEGNVFCRPRKDRIPFDRNRIEEWNWGKTDQWEAVDITKESQYKTESNKRHRRTESIQYRVIQELCAKDYDIIIDDDSSGESADVVAIKVADDRLMVHLFHCKFAKGKVSDRVGDLYEVCGQAQKSIQWRRDVEGLLRHLARRNEEWETKYKITRFQKGDSERLGEITLESRELRADFQIAIVQPGLSRNSVSREQLDLLATTEIYLSDVGSVSFRVIGNRSLTS